MTGTAIDVQGEAELAEREVVFDLLRSLEQEGNATAVALTITDPDLSYETWEALGRFFGSLDKRSRWYIGDWLILGEELFGEEAAQAIEDTQKTRYDEAERVTGLDHGTMMNVRSICKNVARDTRRKELGFWIHAEVAPLDAAEQSVWLERAIEHGWTRRELRDAITLAKNPPVDDDADDSPGEGDDPPPTLSISERIERAARLVYTQGQTTSTGDIIVPRQFWSQLAEALGEE